MNRKRMRKRSISWLLVLSMVLSLFGGEFASPLSAKADGEATITFGDAKISSNGYYTYPDLTVTVANKSKRIHNLTVKASDTVTSGSSDSGYIRVTGTTIEDYLGKKITGKGILTKESLDESMAQRVVSAREVVMKSFPQTIPLCMSLLPLILIRRTDLMLHRRVHLSARCSHISVPFALLPVRMVSRRSASQQRRCQALI